jgi:predicted aspartyl protease
MGTFYTKCKLENVTDRSKSVVLPRMLVDTGGEYTWAPARSLEKIGIDREKKDVLFVMANGQQVTRSVGFAIIRLDKHFTIDEVVFAERGDLLLLGARSLEGLNLTVDSRRKKLVAAGPLPAAESLLHCRSWHHSGAKRLKHIRAAATGSLRATLTCTLSLKPAVTAL